MKLSVHHEISFSTSYPDIPKWQNKFVVKDENGLDKYFIDGNFFKPQYQKLNIRTLQGDVLAYVHHRVLSLMPSFQVFIDDDLVDEIRFKYGRKKTSYTFKNHDWIMVSHTNGHMYSVEERSHPIILVDKVEHDWGESIELDIDDSKNEIMAIAIALSIAAIGELHLRLKKQEG